MNYYQKANHTRHFDTWALIQNIDVILQLCPKVKTMFHIVTKPWFAEAQLLIFIKSIFSEGDITRGIAK